MFSLYLSSLTILGILALYKHHSLSQQKEFTIFLTFIQILTTQDNYSFRVVDSRRNSYYFYKHWMEFHLTIFLIKKDMNTTPFLLLSICTLFLVACNKDEIEDEINTPSNTVLISDITFNSTLLVDGHQYDSLIIENCTFEDIEGDGLQISDVDHLIVRNCVFKNINGNAIRFRNSGSSNFVSIANNEIYNISLNGILAYETHENTVIENNTIHNVGTELASSLNGAPHHGIYFQGPNFLIEKTPFIKSSIQMVIVLA